MPTIKDIAEAVGVSIGTVDRIIHKRGRYSEKTAEKVRRVMEEMNYTPNIHARGLKKTRHINFAAVIPHAGQDSGYWELVIRGINHAAAELSSVSRKSFAEWCTHTRIPSRDGNLVIAICSLPGGCGTHFGSRT